MKHIKQILAFILVVCMVGSMLTTVCAAPGQSSIAAVENIDFTNPADAEKFTIDQQTVSEIREGEGLYMISTKEAFEDCKGQLTGDAAKSPRDVVRVAVSGDWTAVLQLKVDTSGSQGSYEFLGFYGMTDYQNGVGIRAGNRSTVNFKALAGSVESSTDGLKLSTGLTSGTDHWYKLEKSGTTYTGYLSEDGTEYQKIFTYENTGIDATMIVIDAYSGSAVGYQYWLQALTFADNTPVSCEHTYEAVVTPPTCTEGGFTTYTCSKCGDSYVQDETAALGHDFKDGVCTRCGTEANAFLDGITVNGEPLEGFDPKTFEYTLNAGDYETLPVIGCGEAQTTLLITGSDFQDPATSYTRSDYAQNGNYVPQMNRMKAIMGHMQASLGTASYFIGGGDYNFDEIKDSVSKTNYGIDKVREAAEEVCGADLVSVFIQGNHDAPGSNYAPTGPSDTDAFGLFTITEEDYRSYPQDSSKWSDPNKSEAKAQAVADQLGAYLAQKAASGFDKPVFVACHVPIHYNTRTASKGDAMYGDVIYKVLHQYGDDLNIIFLYGHNHAWGDDDYLGAASNFLTHGDTINIAKHGSKTDYTVEPLNFTYMNYGYTGYYWAKWVQSSNQIVIRTDADSTLTMTAFQISGDQVTISRWDEAGMHNLKAKGFPTLGYRNVAEVCEPNLKIVESPLTILADGRQVRIAQFESSPGEAAVTCFDPVSGTTNVYRLKLEDAPKPDKTALNEAIAAAEAIQTEPYTEASVKLLAEAIAAAKAVQADEAATQDDIDAAAKALTDAVAALEEKPEVPPAADKTALVQALEDAAKIDPAEYQSTEELDKAVEAAKTVLADEAATQAQVDEAAKAVRDAIAALVRVPDAPKNPFEDVKEGAYYYDPVLWAVNHDPQITVGTSETTFSPENTCTRAQVVTFLWRAMKCPEPTTADNPFLDVTPDQYYYKAVLWAVEHGITAGISETAFGPDQNCTRAQVVTFLWRTEGKPEPSATANPFRDVGESLYYYKAVLWAVEKGITKGTADNEFSPDATCTRAQIVTFLYRDMKE